MSGTSIQRARILVNPVARSVQRRFDAEGALRFLQVRGIDAELVYPDSTAGGARDAVEAGIDTVFVVGGDGTLREAAMGLAGSNTALAAIPAGTTNVWAREVGIPHGIRTAFESHMSGQRVRMDLGRANGEPFLLMVSAGWDAEVVRTVSHRLKRRAGQGAYVVSAIQHFACLRPVFSRLQSGLLHWDVPLALAVISNTRLYGGIVQPSPGAVANDGLLDVCALCPAHMGDGLRLGARLATRRLAGDLRSITVRVPDFAIETPGIPYQLDGDFAGFSPIAVTIEPSALLVSVPGGELPRILPPRSEA